MAASAYHHGPSSHYPGLASEIRRPPTAGLVDTKPNVSSSAAAAAAASLNFWQSDYHKYSNPSSCLTPTASDCQASFAAAHQAWNYPHPGQYLTTPEQAAAEARRHMDTTGFHAADYTRLQYPHEGIYTHPPGKSSKTYFYLLLTTFLKSIFRLKGWDDFPNFISVLHNFIKGIFPKEGR
jgi:hypothetical protein